MTVAGWGGESQKMLNPFPCPVCGEPIHMAFNVHVRTEEHHDDDGNLRVNAYYHLDGMECVGGKCEHAQELVERVTWIAQVPA